MIEVAQRSVLLVASDSDGHRQNYVAVLGRWFSLSGYSVVIACGPGEDGLPASKSPILSRFLGKSGAVAVDLEKAVVQSPDRFRARLSKLESELQPAWTLLINGEECVRALRGQWKRSSNQCRRAALFIYFSQEYPLDLRPFCGMSKIRPYVRHLLVRYRQRRYFKREVWSKLGLDLILSTDENAVAALSHPQICHIPEIYRAWGMDEGQDNSEIEHLRKFYGDFLNRHQGKDVLLYYGGRFMRRGYDTLLKLTVETPDTLFVSVGRPGPGENVPDGVACWRQQLVEQDRLFEHDIPFLPESSFVDDLFRSARYIILPYRHWYGLSGSLFQAVSYGCPVLVPDIGYMGKAVEQHEIGLTYRHLDFDHLRSRFVELRRNPSRFRDNALRFASRMDEKAVFAALEKNFGVE